MCWRHHLVSGLLEQATLLLGQDFVHFHVESLKRTVFVQGCCKMLQAQIYTQRKQDHALHNLIKCIQYAAWIVSLVLIHIREYDSCGYHMRC